MKLSNFRMIKINNPGTLEEERFAEVDVETGVLWWKKKARRFIRRAIGRYWYFVDSGTYTPTLQAEDLERVWSAQKGLKAMRLLPNATVRELMEALSVMPPDAEAKVVCGYARTSVHFVWLSRGGTRRPEVMLADYGEVVSHDYDRPLEAPTEKEDADWETPWKTPKEPLP